MRPTSRRIAYLAAGLLAAGFVVALIVARHTTPDTGRGPGASTPTVQAQNAPVKPTAYYTLMAMRADPATIAYKLTLRARRCRTEVCLYQATVDASGWAIGASQAAQTVGAQPHASQACRDATAQLTATVSYDETHPVIKPDMKITARVARWYARKMARRLHNYENIAAEILRVC